MNEKAIKDTKNMLLNTSSEYRSKWAKALLDYMVFLDEKPDDERIKTEGTVLKNNIVYYRAGTKLFLYFANQLEESNKDATIQAAEELAK